MEEASDAAAEEEEIAAGAVVGTAAVGAEVVIVEEEGEENAGVMGGEGVGGRRTGWVWRRRRGGGPPAEEFVRDIQFFDSGVTEGQASADLVDRMTAVSLTDVETDAISLPVRPRVGTRGTAVTVLTNHFKTTLDGKKVLYQYDVCISEGNGKAIEKLPMAKSRAILAAALAQAEGAGISKLPIAFDGQKNVFTINDTTLGGTRTLTARLEVVRGPAGAAGAGGKKGGREGRREGRQRIALMSIK